MQNLVATLSKREKDVHDLLCQGLANKEIAKELSISVAGVKYHVVNILNKLGVASRGEVIVYSQNSREIDFPAIGDGGAYSEEQIRQAALRVVELGLGAKKDTNELVINLLGVLAGKIK